MKTGGSELLDRAKREVDLAAFLGAQGWTTATNDGKRWRLLNGPSGQRVLIHQKDGEWLWKYATSGEGGNIYHACTQLLGLPLGKAWGAIRKALAAPPPPLPVGRGGRPSASASTAEAPSSEPPPTRTLAPLTEEVAVGMVNVRCLEPYAVRAFAHRLRTTAEGNLCAPHNAQGDGEEYHFEPNGKTRKHFTGTRDWGAGRGRSLWYAPPLGAEPCAAVIVAESVFDGIALWQKLGADVQARTWIISTAGSFSDAGKKKLTGLLTKARQECVHKYKRKLTVMDAGDVDKSEEGKQANRVREGTIASLASPQGAVYERWAPPEGFKDWNAVVKAERRAAEAQAAEEAAQTAQDQLPLEEEAQDGPHIGGRGR